MKAFCIVICVMLLAACASLRPVAPTSHSSILRPKHDGPGEAFDVHTVPDPKPYNEPKSKQGNPETYVVFGKRYFVMPSSQGYYEEGEASWYGSKFHGNNTSNGEVYNMYEVSAAHKSLPLPTYVEVVNLENNRKIIVRVNDRGPFHGKRIIDLSYAAALKLDMVRTGTANVSVRALTVNDDNTATHATATIPPKWQDQSHLQGRLFTQVGAYSIQANATAVQKKLIAKQFKNVRVYSDYQQGLHRLRLGPHRNSQEAEYVMTKLHAQGYVDAKVVVLDKKRVQ